MAMLEIDPIKRISANQALEAFTSMKNLFSQLQTQPL